MDASQPAVSSLWSVPSLLFQAVKKAQDKRRIQVFYGQARWRFFKCSLGKRDKKSEGVSIAGNGMRTGVALFHQLPRKIRLHQSAKVRFGFHFKRPPSARCQRKVASCNSSGVAERYQ